jgi:cob(I)alamin adenosyltransferase
MKLVKYWRRYGIKYWTIIGDMNKGYVHVYTGEGKGKTTAALGLALRAAGAGKKVFIAQFVKGIQYGEMELLNKYMPEITLRQFGLDCFIVNEPTEKDKEAARVGLHFVSGIIRQGDYDVVILDEVCIAVHYKLFFIEELIEILKSRPVSMEVVLTGRYCPKELIDYADLVTEMKEVKHYFQRGVKARKGIEY